MYLFVACLMCVVLFDFDFVGSEDDIFVIFKPVCFEFIKE